MDYRRVLTAGLLQATLLFAHAAAAQDVPQGYREVAMRHGVPPESLYSVALTETSMSPKGIISVTRGAGPAPDVERPWPWTINVAGKGYRYATRLQAWEALQGFLKKYPRKRIDVGIAQVNLGWNGHHFTSTWEAFEPYTNLNAAAAILRECYNRNPGSWLTAAGCYHHPAGGAPAARYKSIVRTKLARLNRSATTTPVVSRHTPDPTPAATQTVALTWVEPRVNKLMTNKQLEDLKEQLPAALATWQQSKGRRITVGWLHAVNPEVIGALLAQLDGDSDDD